jgi:hypothetical protein
MVTMGLFDSVLNFLDGDEIIKKLDDAAAVVEKFTETVDDKLAFVEEKVETAGTAVDKVVDKLPGQ